MWLLELSYALSELNYYLSLFGLTKTAAQIILPFAHVRLRSVGVNNPKVMATVVIGEILLTSVVGRYGVGGASRARRGVVAVV